jgi:hypothetical protein
MHYPSLNTSKYVPVDSLTAYIHPNAGTAWPTSLLS